MADEMQSGMHCAEFETLLFEAIDGTLVAGTLTRFQVHASTCASCCPTLDLAAVPRRDDFVGRAPLVGLFGRRFPLPVAAPPR